MLKHFTMIKTIIIDDEQHCITTLQWTLQEYCKDVKVTATAHNGTDAILLINVHQPDLIFLDVEMPIMNGIDMLLHFDDIKFNVVFTTAYDQYAVKAIKLNALDYLLKPIDKDDLIAAVNKVKNKQLQISRQQVEGLNEVHRTKVANKIALSTLAGLQFINLDDLVRVEGEGNYCNFILKGKKKILLSKKLGDAEDILKGNDHFFRAHKSHIINLKFVEKYVRGEGGEIIMEDGTSISLSRNKKDEFLELFAKV
jgi:two-component system, LytTR family, response regulator